MTTKRERIAILESQVTSLYETQKSLLATVSTLTDSIKILNNKIEENTSACNENFVNQVTYNNMMNTTLEKIYAELEDQGLI